MGMRIGAVLLVCAVVLSGCNIVGLRPQSPFAANGPARVGPSGLEPSEIQSELMSFDDTFANIISQEWNQAGSGALLPEGEAKPTAEQQQRMRRVALELKIANVSGALSIASSPNPMVAVGDMITMITLQRLALQEPWANELFGPGVAGQLADTYYDQEQKIWALGDKIFTKRQGEQLRDVIAQWRQEHPDQRYVSGIRLEAYARARQQSVASSESSGSLFSLLMLDPLAGLDPATREVQQSRMLGERIFYYASRMPQLMKWQAQSLSESVLNDPSVRSAVASAAKMSDAADRISRVAEQFPRERKETLDQFFGGVTAQREALMSDLRDDRGQIQDTLKEFRATIDAGQDLAKTLNTTIQSAQSLAKQVNPPGQPAAPKKEEGPDPLEQYKAAAAQTTLAADRLTGFADRLDSVLNSEGWNEVAGSVQNVTAGIQSSGERLIDRMFWRMLIIVLVTPFAVVGALALYRMGSRRGVRVVEPPL